MAGKSKKAASAETASKDGETQGKGLPNTKDPLEFLLAAMNDTTITEALRVRAAVAAVQYTHKKTGDGGIKESKKAAADKALGGKFSQAMPPKLVVNNR
jgi:hypothetical protein